MTQSGTSDMIILFLITPGMIFHLPGLFQTGKCKGRNPDLAAVYRVGFPFSS
jgi:hypothetical protein